MNCTKCEKELSKHGEYTIPNSEPVNPNLTQGKAYHVLFCRNENCDYVNHPFIVNDNGELTSFMV